MSERTRRVVAWLVVGVSAALYALTVGLSAFDGARGTTLAGAGVLAFAIVGGLVLVRRPENPTGALLSAVALAMTALAATTEYADRALVIAPGTLPGGRIAAYLVMWFPLVAIGLLVALLPQVFPSGRALSRRWRPGIWAAWVYIVVGTVANVLDPQVVEGVGNYQNPYGVKALAPYLGPFLGVSSICLGISVISGLVTLVLRWRRAVDDERQQLKWFA